MANEITFDKPPGYYLSNMTVNMRLAAEVESLRYSVNGGAPAISKFIAYDTLTPPNPFIAVTQDGRGNVVYDGGFPKFYNNYTPAAGVTTFEQLSASFKYFYNAMKFIQNPVKIAAGNNKILLVGDATLGVHANYCVKDAVGGGGFSNTFNKLAQICGYQLTIKDAGDWGGVINATLGELEQYCAVILMSSVHQAAGAPYLISTECVDAMLTYRENGNGIMVITDHGPAISTIAQAVASNQGGFFATANALVTGFGVWFSGTVDRVPVNVGFLRTTYGDHPLYNGMLNGESIHAGASESRVNVASFDSVSPNNVPPITIANGRTVIQVAAVLTSGEIVTYRATYYVVSFKISFTDGEVVRDNGQILNVGLKNQSLVNVVFEGSLDEVATGIIYKNQVKVGTVTRSVAGEVVQTWDDAWVGPVLVNDKDEFKVIISQPFSMTSAIIIDRFQPQIPTKQNLSNAMKTLRTKYPELTDIKRVGVMIEEIGESVPWLGLKQVQSIPINLRVLSDYFKNQGLASLVLPNAKVAPYDTGRVWTATGNYAHWVPTNPVTNQPVRFTNIVFSPVHGSEKVPANFKMDYYANVFIPAGNYQVIAHADDIFDLYIDGGLVTSLGARGTANFTLTESRYYSLKVSNTNVPLNTPSYWTCLFIDLNTGDVVLSPQPGVWKTQEYVVG